MLSHFSHVRLCDPMDCSPQAPLSMGFSRQEYWSKLPCPPPGDLLDPGTEPASLHLLHWQVGPLKAKHRDIRVTCPRSQS